MVFRFAEDNDLPKIHKFLEKSGLPHNDIEGHISNYLLAEEDKELIGSCGIEIAGSKALLRSLAVKESKRNNGIGKLLLNKMKNYAKLNNVNKIYLLTTTAKKFFKNCGFTEVARDTVPTEIKNTEEFENICPSSAICMVKNVGKEVKFCSKDILHLKDDIPGAKMWGVSLEKTMFTYFEVQPNSSFEPHSHESEQITMVLEGVLYFNVEETVYPVQSGEVMAIPSNIPHSVFTKDSTVKAVDAWSPIMNKYLNS